MEKIKIKSICNEIQNEYINLFFCKKSEMFDDILEEFHYYKYDVLDSKFFCDQSKIRHQLDELHKKLRMNVFNFNKDIKYLKTIWE